jgi:fructose-1,6-bisphosphatase/sedoheptulose 1,7-bisphosphatase-like protein
MSVVTSGEPDASTTYAPEKNIHNIIGYNNIKSEELAVIVMNPETRPINAPIAKAAEDMHVGKIIIINYGSLMSGVHAMIEPGVFGAGIKKAVFMGRQGAEEDTISAGVAKILGATSESQEYFVIPAKDGNKASYELGKTLSLNEVIPGSPEDLIFNGTLVTNSKWTDKQGVRNNQNGGHIATTMTITKNHGVVYRDVHLPPQDQRLISEIYRRNLGTFALPR